MGFPIIVINNKLEVYGRPPCGNITSPGDFKTYPVGSPSSKMSPYMIRSPNFYIEKQPKNIMKISIVQTFPEWHKTINSKPKSGGFVIRFTGNAIFNGKSWHFCPRLDCDVQMRWRFKPNALQLHPLIPSRVSWASFSPQLSKREHMLYRCVGLPKVAVTDLHL